MASSLASSAAATARHTAMHTGSAQRPAFSVQPPRSYTHGHHCKSYREAARQRRTEVLPARPALAQIHPTTMTHPKQPGGPLLFYIPGADGSGQAIAPQIAALAAAGITVVSLYIPPSDRSTWDLLLLKLIPLLRKAVADAGRPAIMLGESFGSCLALRCALAVPELLSDLVLINSATSFDQSLFGLAAVVSSSNLLSFFPESLYNTAQTVIMPLLLDSGRTSKDIQGNLKAMLNMAERPTDEAIARTKTSSIFHEPAMAANFRINLLKEGNLSDKDFRRITTKTLLICSAKDRLFASLKEGARLQQLMPNARRLILPQSSHTPMLESDINIVNILRHAGVLSAASSASTTATPGPTSAGPQNPVPPQGLQGTQGSVSGTIGTPAAGSRPASSRPLGALSQAAAVTPAGPQPPGLSSANSPCSAAALKCTVGAAGVSASAVATASGSNGSSNGSSSNGVGSSERLKTGSSGATATEVSSVRVATANGNGASATAAAAPQGATAGSGTKKSGTRFNIGVYNSEFEAGAAQFNVWRELVSPLVLGVEHLPSLDARNGRPLLFVGNHTQFGLYDLPLLFIEMYYRGYQLTGLAHVSHWKTPLGPWFERFGAVKASPLAAYRALNAGQNVLLFPGGGREVMKRRGERYQLQWKADTDFVRLAAKCNAIIVPFGAVGADDAFDLYMDTDEILANDSVGPLAQRILASMDPSIDPAEAIFPITKIPGTDLPSPLPFPNLNRVYFKIGKPIDAAGINPKDVAACSETYANVRTSVEEQISDLLLVRESDPDSSAIGRLVNSAQRLWPRAPM